MMADRESSLTALVATYIRAAHQLFDAQPLILDDPVALSLLGADAAIQIRQAVERHQTPEGRVLRAHVVLRSRFTEDRLAAAVFRGIKQYVILGAGFDTFAFRQPQWAKKLKIFEVDHPGTQAMKRSKLAAAGIVLPENLVFADVDFEKESLHDGLCRHRVSNAELTFFSWLGVTMYLKEDAIDAVLKTVAAFPESSEIVLTFIQPPTSLSDAEKKSYARLVESVASAGEPFESYFEPDALEAKLRNLCFSKMVFLSPADAQAGYFQQRPNDLPAPAVTNIVAAIR
jgi:methyltransferase (TIGR00027 family)